MSEIAVSSGGILFCGTKTSEFPILWKMSTWRPPTQYQGRRQVLKSGWAGSNPIGKDYNSIKRSLFMVFWRKKFYFYSGQNLEGRVDCPLVLPLGPTALSRVHTVRRYGVNGVQVKWSKKPSPCQTAVAVIMKLLVTDCHTVMAHLLASCNIVLFSLLEDDKITVHCHVPECHVTHRVSGILYSRSSQKF